MSEPIRIKTTTAKPDPMPDDKPVQPSDSQPGPNPDPSPEPKPEPRPIGRLTDLKSRPRPLKQQSSSTPGAKFAAFAAVTVLASAGALAALWPVTLAAAHQESAELVGEASYANPGEAATDYLLATWLDHHNTAAYAGLARTQIATGRPDAALASLSHAGQGSEVEQLRVRTLIELGRPDAAADAAATLTASNRSQDDLLLAVLAYDNAGRPDNATALIPRLTSPEAAQAAARAQAGPLGLAAELSATGLLRSSSAILVKTPTSYDRNLQLARIRYAQHTKATLAEATDYLISANALNPANINARQLLAKIYRELGNTHDAQVQAALIAKLQSGRP